MASKVQKHHRIRFRRSEISSLDTLPSARGPALRPHGRRRRHRRLLLWRRLRRGLRRGLYGIGAFALVLPLVFIGFNLFAASDFGSEKLRGAAEQALTALAGVDVDAEFGHARLSLDPATLLALQVSDVRLRMPGAEESIIEAGSVRFGVSLVPLLAGQMRLGSATLEGARIRPQLLPESRGEWAASLFDERGLVAPDRLLKAVFSAARDAVDAVRTGTAGKVALRDVDILTPDGPVPGGIRVRDATVSRTDGGAVAVEATFLALGMAVALEGTVESAEAGRIGALAVAIDAKPLHAAGGKGEAVPLLRSLDPFTLKLSGAEAGAGQPGRLDLSLSLAGASIDLGKEGILALSGSVDAAMVAGTGKIEFSRVHILSGRSEFDFHGAIGPEPPEPGGRLPPAYRYEFVSDGSTAAPADSPEPALPFLARIAGRYDAAARRLTAAEIGVRTGPGELFGHGSVTFVPGEAPAADLAITMPAMPVQHVKQLWPWVSAPGARRWVLANLFAGEVKNSSVRFQVPAGRLGNGIPLSDEEVSGHFEVEGTRFDIAGNIPPIRDGNGTVDFSGSSVDIGLSSGTVYLPSGRTVAAQNGVFVLRDVHIRPLIGALDIDVAGNADAVTELASYDPINAMRHLDFAPEDFSGAVSGHVTAQIPLTKGVSMDGLAWKVALDYSGLSVAKPFDGQKLTDASGSIVVEPDRAVVDAAGRLNGIPADLSVTEPLGEHGPERRRRITLSLDDAAREEFLPGLKEILSGPVSVAVDASGKDAQDISADLTRATLSLPWAGWVKGAGVPATVAFRLGIDGKGQQLSDFRLSGRTFEIAGTVALSDGALTSARFRTVRLNKGDDVALDLSRSAAGYQVKVRGSALDARSLIRQMMDDTGAAAVSGAGRPVSVALDAEVAAVTGFNGESLGKVTLSYRGAGSRLDRLSVSATTRTGVPFTVESRRDGGRKVEVRADDAGAVLRFLDVYQHVEGGQVKLSLAGQAEGPLTGEMAMVGFEIVNEPKLKSIVSAAPQGGDGRSLNDVVRRDIDATRVAFERGFALIRKGDGYLQLERGVLRGPTIGTTFQGTVYDRNGNMDLTGTFMPAYGLNRLFGEIPIVGQILGNGRDRALIGITYRLAGDAKAPKLQVNPLSIVAPGIFRSIFEFR